MLKWLVFCALWIIGLFLGDVTAASSPGGTGSRLVFFGGMWMLTCVAAKEAIAGYQATKARTPRSPSVGQVLELWERQGGTWVKLWDREA